MSAIGLVASRSIQPLPEVVTIKEAIEGNLCMCTGYQQIVSAIEDAAEKMKG